MNLFKDAQEVIAGGVNSPVRAFAGVGGEPVFFRAAKGAWLEAEDGRRFIDYVGSWGPMILGHGHPAVIDAVTMTAKDGLSFGAPCVLETRIAAKIRSLVPSIEKLRMVSSGTEATMSAIRLARGHTRRDKIVKFEGCYHGHSDSLLIKAGSGALTLGVPSSPGVPAVLAEHTITLTYNDADAVKAAFAEFGAEIACVIVEPIAGNMNMVPPVPGFLETLRDECTRAGSVLILDEVMTGFRVAKGGAQALFGIEPDLTTLGKIVNPVAMAAGLATLEEIDKPGFYEALSAKTSMLANGLASAANDAGVPIAVEHAGGMFGFVFTADAPVRTFAQVGAADVERFKRFFHGMLAEGVYLAPSAFEAGFVSAAHGDDEIEKTLAAAAKVLRLS